MSLKLQPLPYGTNSPSNPDSESVSNEPVNLLSSKTDREKNPDGTKKAGRITSADLTGISSSSDRANERQASANIFDSDTNQSSATASSTSASAATSDTTTSAAQSTLLATSATEA